MKAVYSDKHRSHDPQFFLVRGQVRRTTEQPERADRLLKGLKDGKHTLVDPTEFGQGPRARVHSPEYLRFLEGAWDEWTQLPGKGDAKIRNLATWLQFLNASVGLPGKGEKDGIRCKNFRGSLSLPN